MHDPNTFHSRLLAALRGAVVAVAGGCSLLPLVVLTASSASVQEAVNDDSLGGIYRDQPDAAGDSSYVASHRNFPPVDHGLRVPETASARSDQNIALASTALPTWYQANLVHGTCAAAGVLILWGLYRYRHLQLAHEANLRFEERLGERSRIAGELHDTLLQTIAASKLLAQEALAHPDDAVSLARSMEQVSIWLGEAVLEGRAVLSSLRSSIVTSNDLEEAFRAMAEAQASPVSPAVELTVIGHRRELHPLVRDEVFRIGCEAIRNASRHSLASRLEIVLHYGADFRVRVHDNGVGIESTILAKGRPGHFGLVGMRERAARIAADLRVLSAPGDGTTLTLQVAGRVAFLAPGPRNLVSRAC